MSKKTSFVDKYLSFYSDAKEVLSLFNNQYAILPAYTPEQNSAAYRLRHNIYCNELGFERSNDDQVEKDAFDAISTQIVLHYKPLNASIGCVRFVHGVIDGVTNTLPFEETCGEGLDRELFQKIKNSGHKYAEISRLGIDRQFRHMGRADRSKVKSPVRSSCALLALLLGVQAFAKQSDTKYLMAIVEKKLWNSMKKFSIPIMAMGEPVDHHGKRYPILMDRDEIEKIVPLLMRPLYSSVQRDMAKLAEIYQSMSEAEMEGSGNNIVTMPFPATPAVALDDETPRSALMS